MYINKPNDQSTFKYVYDRIEISYIWKINVFAQLQCILLSCCEYRVLSSGQM